MFPKKNLSGQVAKKLYLDRPIVQVILVSVALVLSQCAIVLAFRQQHAKMQISHVSSILNAQGSPVQAETVGKRAVEMNPRDGYAWFYYGTAQYLQGEMPEAIKSLEIATRVLPHSYNALRLLAFSHYKEQRFDEASRNLADYLTMVPLPPVSPEMVYRMAGLAFLRMADLAKANYYLIHATELTEEKGELLRVRATASLLCNQSWSAEYCFRAFRFYLPEQEFNPFELVTNAAKANKMPMAVDFFQAAHFRDRDDISVIKALAAAYVTSGQTENARTLLKNTVGLQPDNASLRLAYGDVLFASKMFKDAFEQYDEHLRLEPESRFRQDILRKKATTRY